MMKKNSSVIEKIICVTIAALILHVGVLLADTRHIGDPYQLIYTALDQNGTHISNQTIIVKIKKTSNGQWLDFNDSSFKASGWANKSATLTEDTTEKYYFYTFAPPGSETTPEQYAFVIDNANVTYKDHQAVVVNYQNIGNSTNVSISQTSADKVWNTALPGNYTGSQAGYYLQNEIKKTRGR